MKRKTLIAPQLSLMDPIAVDNFAGGGGASTGMELALGRPVDIAINHDPAAILMHKTNHPYTTHYQASVWDVDPVQVCAGRPVGVTWFSPDCKHFSKAKGAALVDRNIRGLAWIALRWAGTVRPKVIILENVEEFVTWGPVRKGKPVKSKKGQTFQRFVSQLRELGYCVEWRELVAADYGVPTTRKRFYLIARCDGKPIVWPEATHAPADSEAVKSGKLLPWRSAAEIIDWSLPAYSIFDSRKEIKERFGVNAVRPLADNTMRRIIRGVDKFTIRSGKPFLVPTGYGERTGQAPRIHDVEAPLPTVVGSGKHNLCQPLLSPLTVTNTSNSVGHPASQPIDTARTGGGGGQMLVSTSLMAIGQTSGGERTRKITEPTHTQVSKAEECLVSASLIQYHTEQTEKHRGQSLADPLSTVDGSNRYGMAVANLVEYYSAGRPINLREPLHTVTARDREALVTAHIAKFYGGVVGSGVTDPLPTVTAIDHNALVTSHITEFKGQDIGQPMGVPLRTITASAGEFGEVRTIITRYAPEANLQRWPEIRTLLNRYCGYHLAEDEILLLKIGDSLYFIADILLRMLSASELYAAMGFPPDYIINRDYMGNEYKKTAQVARCGNAVCPPMATALVRANVPDMCVAVDISTMRQLNKLIAV